MIDVLVPVLGRPANAQPLADSLHNATHHPYRLIFICSPRDKDQMAACLQTGAETWQVPWGPGKADYAKKINWAYPRTHNPWIFTGADDIRFHPNWDLNALHTGEQHPVVGTNDLHHPGCRNGSHATHLLVNRTYIDEYGGTYDNTGLVFSEAYDHQFVDNEFIHTARRRKQWGYCKTAVVEHLHPNWGNAATDPTYVKAQRHTRHDHRLYLRRVRLLEKTPR